MKLLINNGRISPLFFSTRGKLLTAITDRNIDVTLSGVQNGCDELIQAFNVSFESIDIERTGTNLCKDFALISRYLRFYRKKQYDVVHSYTVKPNIYGSIGARICGIQKIYPTVNGLGYVFTDTGTHTIKQELVQRANLFLYWVAFKCSTKVFFQNSDDAEELISHHVIPREKCVLIPGSGIDLNRFAFCPIRNNNVFLFASRLLLTKGIQTFMEAAKRTKKEYPEARFLIAGGLLDHPDGLKESDLLKAVEEGYVEYLGHVDDMPAQLTECSAFVLPSYYREGVPHAILEAMSIGRPIITCNSPGCRETVSAPDENGRGKNGFVIDPKDSNALYEDMKWLLNHPDEVVRMGLESRRYAEEKFDVEIVNSIMMTEMGLNS